jgi:hypothetical protein
MTRRNRETLRKRFGDGEMPSTKDFGDLIESMLNIHDDGIAHNERDGLRLTQIDGDNKILSFYSAIEEKSAVWSLGLDAHRSSLTLEVGAKGGAGSGAKADGGGVAVLTLLAPEQRAGSTARVGINNLQPRHALDVGGTVAATGRIGEPGKHVAPADGEWHTISVPMTGCSALEVMAGVGKKHSGKYALMHAFAMKAFDAKGDFTYHQTHYDLKRHRMQLQWVAAEKEKDAYQLQIRVNCAYGPDVWIRYQITNLWFDPFMNECAKRPDPKEAP